MKTRRAVFGATALMGFVSTSAAQTIQFNRYVMCRGERLLVQSCYDDDDRSDCMVLYPDRPLRNGFQVQIVERRGDVIAKLKACQGRDATPASAGNPASRPALPPAAVTAPPTRAADQPAAVKPGEGASADAYVKPGDESLADGYVKLGDQSLKAKDYAKAEESYKKAIAHDPARGNAHFGVGLAYFKQGKYQLAVRALQRAQTLIQFNANDFIVLGEALIESKQYDEALKTYQSMLRLKPGREDASYAYSMIGRIYNLQKRHAEAVTALQEVLIRDRDYESAYFELGVAYSELKQDENALRAFQRAVRLNPEDPDYQCWLGNANLVLGNYPGAVAAFQQALRLKPDYVECYSSLGLAYIEMDNKEQALRVYKRLQKIDTKAAQKLLEDIGKMK